AVICGLKETRIETCVSSSDAIKLRLKANTRNRPKIKSATLTALTAANFIQLLRARLLTASLKCRKNVSIFITVLPSLLVADNDTLFDCNRPFPHGVNNLLIVGRHDHGRSTRVDFLQQIHDTP